jgi:hypothetical protein
MIVVADCVRLVHSKLKLVSLSKWVGGTLRLQQSDVRISPVWRALVSSQQNIFKYTHQPCYSISERRNDGCWNATSCPAASAVRRLVVRNCGQLSRGRGGLRPWRSCDVHRKTQTASRRGAMEFRNRHGASSGISHEAGQGSSVEHGKPGSKSEIAHLMTHYP